jgi:hypothetical protein
MEHQLQLNLGPGLMPDVATGAMFTAILAWPTAAETHRFHRVSNELIGASVKRTKDPQIIQDLKSGSPHLDWASIEACSRKKRPAFGGLEARSRQRMAAARAAIGKAHKQIFGIDAELPPGMTATSLDQLCKLIGEDVSIDDPENIEKLVWRASLPIIHLAMATQLMLAGRHPDPGQGPDLQDRAFYRDAVRLAQRFEDLVDQHPGFAITRERLTLVRWYE